MRKPPSRHSNPGGSRSFFQPRLRPVFCGNERFRLRDYVELLVTNLPAEAVGERELEQIGQRHVLNAPLVYQPKPRPPLCAPGDLPPAGQHVMLHRVLKARLRHLRRSGTRRLRRDAGICQRPAQSPMDDAVGLHRRRGIRRAVARDQQRVGEILAMHHHPAPRPPPHRLTSGVRRADRPPFFKVPEGDRRPLPPVNPKHRLAHRREERLVDCHVERGAVGRPIIVKKELRQPRRHETEVKSKNKIGNQRAAK